MGFAKTPFLSPVHSIRFPPPLYPARLIVFLSEWLTSLIVSSPFFSSIQTVAVVSSLFIFPICLLLFLSRSFFFHCVGWARTRNAWQQFPWDFFGKRIPAKCSACSFQKKQLFVMSWLPNATMAIEQNSYACRAVTILTNFFLYRFQH